MARTPIVYVLDIKGTHDNPGYEHLGQNCKMRIAQDASGQWYCIDCGRHIHSVPLKVLT